jgi:transcriptional regulator with XRE-family HTH domain
MKLGFMEQGSIGIRSLRDRTKMSQKEFAEHFEIPLSTLRKWEQGESKPAPYVVKLLAMQIRGKAEELQTINCKDESIFYYDHIQGTLSDTKGNTIIVHENLSGVKEQNLPLYVKDLFEAYYEIQDKFDRDCRFDKTEDIIWS